MPPMYLSVSTSLYLHAAPQPSIDHILVIIIFVTTPHRCGGYSEINLSTLWYSRRLVTDEPALGLPRSRYIFRSCCGLTTCCSLDGTTVAKTDEVITCVFPSKFAQLARIMTEVSNSIWGIAAIAKDKASLSKNSVREATTSNLVLLQLTFRTDKHAHFKYGCSADIIPLYAVPLDGSMLYI